MPARSSTRRASSRSTTAPAISTPDRILEHWGDPFDLVDPGIAFKRHPCCGSHPSGRRCHAASARGARPVAGARRQGRVLDASAPARAHQPAQSAERARRQVLDPIRARARADARHRQHGAFLRRRRARSGDARADGARACRARSRGQERDQRSFLCRLRITTAAGETFEHFVDRPVGRDRDHPLPPGALEAKFRDCAQTRARRARRWKRLLDRCASRWRRCRTCPTFSTSSRPA